MSAPFLGQEISSSSPPPHLYLGIHLSSSLSLFSLSLSLFLSLSLSGLSFEVFRSVYTQRHAFVAKAVGAPALMFPDSVGGKASLYRLHLYRLS